MVFSYSRKLALISGQKKHLLRKNNYEMERRDAGNNNLF
jgi:hypothetical protein